MKLKIYIYINIKKTRQQTNIFIQNIWLPTNVFKIIQAQGCPIRIEIKRITFLTKRKADFRQ